MLQILMNLADLLQKLNLSYCRGGGVVMLTLLCSKSLLLGSDWLQVSGCVNNNITDGLLSVTGFITIETH